MSNLPTVTSNIPQDLRNFLDRVRDKFNSVNDDQLITARSLIAAGIAARTRGYLGPAVTRDTYGPPPAPTNLEATGAMINIILSWDENYYPGHAYTEVWAAGETDGGAPAIGNAVPIAMVPGFQFADDVGEDQTRYYWVRFINVEGEAGPYNAVEGTKGHTGIEFETPPSPTDLKAVVDGENVILSWDEDKYHGYAYTEIWSADGTGGKEPTLSDASPLFMVPGFEYVDNLGENKTRYYWVRFVNGKGEAGPYNDEKGTVAVTKVRGHGWF